MTSLPNENFLGLYGIFNQSSLAICLNIPSPIGQLTIKSVFASQPNTDTDVITLSSALS
jgi:hypothetical protein